MTTAKFLERTHHEFGIMTRIVVAVLLALSAAAAERTPGPVSEGMPFGRIEEADFDRLHEFALKRGFNLKAEMARVYGQKKVDGNALGRVFVFSRNFKTLDKNARAYGQIVYSSLMNVGEQIGVPAYVKIIDRQSPDVQQRIRDFLFYPVTRSEPKPRWEDALSGSREMYPGLFPKGFQFGNDDPIFANER